jgi:rhodanese-related sulfurtransferase
MKLGFASAFAMITATGIAFGQEVAITEDMPSVKIETNNEVLVIERIQDKEHRLSSDFTKTSRPCPPFCIAPMEAAPGVATYGELEVIAFMQDALPAEKGLLIDARIPSWFQKGSIPGAINVPFPLFSKEDNPYHDDILQALGAARNADGWDFTDAKALTVFCNGPWCDQSPLAIRNLVDSGYPADKLFYYRGGMQAWLAMGLSVTNQELLQTDEEVAQSAGGAGADQ